MNGLFSGWPYPLAVLALTVVAFIRGNLTYWVGQAAQAGAGRTRARRWMQSAGYRRAQRLVHRWGPPIVSLSFLTIGLQTLINLSAGVTRMPQRRYLPAVAVGAVLWGFLYATVGFVTFAAWFRLYALSPVGAVVVLAVMVAAVTAFVLPQIHGTQPWGPTYSGKDHEVVPDPAESSAEATGVAVAVDARD